jgi:hypothetical protein
MPIWFWPGFSLPVLVLISRIGMHGERRPAEEKSDGTIAFALSKPCQYCFAAVAVLLGYTALPLFLYTPGAPGVVGALGLLLSASVFMFSLPGTLVAAPDGLRQTYWLRAEKFIAWDEIREIRDLGHRGALLILGARKKSIIYSSPMAGRPRLIQELKQHCGDDIPDFALAWKRGSAIKP